MSTHNLCFHGEIRKTFTGYLFLFRAIFIDQSMPLTRNHSDDVIPIITAKIAINPCHAE